MSVYEKLEAHNITLPELTPPVAAFVPYLRSGKLRRATVSPGSASLGRISRPHRVKRPLGLWPSI